MPKINFKKPFTSTDSEDNVGPIVQLATSITRDDAEVNAIISFLRGFADEKGILFANAMANPPGDFERLLKRFLGEKKAAGKLRTDLETKEAFDLKLFGPHKSDFERCLLAMEQMDRATLGGPRSIVDILNRDGFLSANETYYPADLSAALEGYRGSLGGGALVVIQDCDLYMDPGEALTADLAKLEKPIKDGAARSVTAQSSRILLAINNGTHHFIFADLSFAPDGSVTLSLKDSMEKRRASIKHQKNNEKILKNLEEAVRRFYPTATITKKEPEYTGEQGDNANCPFYTVREVVTAVSEAKTHPEIKIAVDDLLVPDKDITKFQLSMSQKVARKSGKLNPEELAVDKFGILHKAAPELTMKYKDYHAKLHFQFDMSLESYNASCSLYQRLSRPEEKGVPSPAPLAAWLLGGTPLTLANVIRALCANTTPLPLTLSPAMVAEVKAGQKCLAKSIIANSLMDQFSVDDIFLDAGAGFSAHVIEEHVLKKTATVQSLTVQTVSGGSSSSALVLVLKVPPGLPPEVKIPEHLQAKLKYWGDLLVLEKAEVKGEEVALVLRSKLPEEKDAEATLKNLKHMVYDADTRFGIFNPEVDLAVEEELRKLIAAKARVAPTPAPPTPTPTPAPTPAEHKVPIKPDKPPAPATTTTVFVVSASGGARHEPIITSPAKSGALVERNVWHTMPSRDTHFMVVSRTKSNKLLETARKQLCERLERDPTAFSPPPDVPDAIVPLKTTEVCVKHYIATEVKLEPEVQGLLRDRTLKQCGVIEKTIKQGRESQLEFLLPPKTRLEKNTANFNVFLFDFIHRAIQEQITKQGGVVPGKKHSIRLNGVYSPTRRLTSAELAMVQYCHLMGLGCQYAKGGEVDIKKVLRANGMVVDEGREKSAARETAFARAFDAFITAPTASTVSGLSLGGGMPGPGHRTI